MGQHYDVDIMVKSWFFVLEEVGLKWESCSFLLGRVDGCGLGAGTTPVGEPRQGKRGER